MDTMIHIAKLSDNGTKAVMRCAKSKDSEAWKEQTFDLTTHLDSVRVWWDEPSDGSEADDKRKSETAKEILDVLSSAKAGLTAKQISEAIDAKQQAANNVLKRLEKEELVTRSQNSRGTWCFAITDRGKAALQDKILV
jgi:predicted transcriptional regulator